MRAVLFRVCTMFSNANIIVSESDLRNVRRVQPIVRNVSPDSARDRFRSAINMTVERRRTSSARFVWMGTVANVVRKGVDRALRVLR